jgi:HlyD family secretion protein
MTRRLALGLVLVALMVGAAALLLGQPPSVPAVVVRAAPLTRTLQFSARVATASRVELGATVTGRVAEVLVAEGDTVRRGQALVRLETDELRAALDQAQAAERQAAARVAGLRSTGRLGSQAALAQAEATQRAAEAELKRARELVAQGFVSAQRLDDAQRALDVARAQASAARAQGAANADQGTDVVQAQAQQALAAAATRAAQARLAQAVVAAPTEARVLTREVEPGQIVQPGRALLVLALAGPLELQAQVDERYLEQLRPGQDASVVADAFPGQRFAARVKSIAPRVDAQRGAIEVKLSPPEPPPPFLREDMTLSVEVQTAQRPRALALPLSALRGDPSDDRASVLLARDGRVESREVRLGLRTLEAAEVTQGLAEGDVVLIGDVPAPGKRVRPDTAAAAAAASAPRAKGEDAGAALTNAMGR